MIILFFVITSLHADACGQPILIHYAKSARMYVKHLIYAGRWLQLLAANNEFDTCSMRALHKRLKMTCMIT